MEEINPAVIEMVNELQTKYKDNQYMMQRLDTHLSNLPNILEQECKRHEQRVTRFNELTLEQDNFYKVFLSKHQYFYMPFNSLYYEYDGKTYKIAKDDDIHYRLLSTITDEGKLIQWKHKTKQNIIKKIKDRLLFKSTPETYTIQNVLGFFQTMFQTKSEAKYFLTLLGDCILKKNVDNLLYFISPNLKKIITLIDAIVYVTAGTSILSNFITKFHDNHKLHLYRLIKTTNILSIDMVKDVLNNIGIDLCCVATHYSDRYENSDNYLNTKIDIDIKNNIAYFVQNSTQAIVENFIDQCIDTNTTSDTNISWKNMHYIWKLHIASLNIPNMIYSQQLQELLTNKMAHTNELGTIVFTNVTSKYLPDVSLFLSFWDKHIVITTDSSVDDEYEVDELLTLCKIYDKKLSQLTDMNMIKMICHFYSPQVEIIDNKYIYNIRCNLCSKTDDVQEFLQSYKTNTQTCVDIISFDELYQSYKNYVNAKSLVEQRPYLIVSKQFFEKSVTNQLSEFIKFDKFVSSEWLQ
jgi:hypothetical protein